MQGKLNLPRFEHVAQFLHLTFLTVDFQVTSRWNRLRGLSLQPGHDSQLFSAQHHHASAGVANFFLET